MASPARYPAGDQVRRAMIGKVKIAQKELQLDDGAYRAMLQRITGETSAADCTVQQLGKVLDEMKAKGWSPKLGARAEKPVSRVGVAPTSRRPAQSPMAKKARAMWISLYQLGVVRDPSEGALESFGRRQLGVDRLQWADEGQAFRLIEALKAMAERAGWSQDVSGHAADRHVLLLKLRLAERLRVLACLPWSLVTAATVDQAIKTYAHALGRGPQP